jgi:hypothetical protein
LGFVRQGPDVVVVDQILEAFIGEVIEIIEGRALDDVVVEGAPEAFDLAVGLRSVGSCVVLDAEIEEQYAYDEDRLVLRGGLSTHKHVFKSELKSG